MNILIVDDNKNNRMILRLLLEDYMDEHENVSFVLDEAEDGQVAVEKCQDKNFDIVLMDIMMPNMDGIEATKIIRAQHPKILIVAVSAVDDGERQRLILNNGAEDYIAKPVNADIFVSRMSNYISLSESRNHKKMVKNHINLFSNKIYSRHTNFIIDSEDSLAEFWEFFLLNARKKSDYLADVVRSIFTIVEKQLQLSNYENYLYIEESDEKQYFTLLNISVLPLKIIQLILIKNSVKEGYKIEGSKLSFELLKVEQSEEDDFQIIRDVKTNQVESLRNEEPIISPKINITSSATLQVFDYMESEDLLDLEEYAGKLNSIMLIVGGGGVTEDEVIDLYTYLDKIGSVLATYSEVYPISKALTELSVDMSSHIQEFIDNSQALGPMCKAFSNDMTSWIKKSFHSGAPSADFMNDTIVVNCQTIASMLKMTEIPADDDFDDIFDF
ncbi:MAG: response regulator [Helicobacteraceae bacterium]|nr:response regulator [Candidatus Sulfurimonas ponti]MBL6973313.1 response regulator [Sulfurimonas sp.]